MRECVIPSVLDRRRDEAYFAEDGLCVQGVFSYENVRKQFLSDVLGIPLREIREVRVATPFLWKRHARQKQGILDMALELNRGTKVNVEMQVRRQSAWTKRELFYLAKMYTEDLKAGQDYERLHRCVSIGLLDFNLTERERYHSRYRLREADGTELTDLLEIHIVELSKALWGRSRWTTGFVCSMRKGRRIWR
ncbi:Rpn family recombination-promoting nuclease/putative transposase [uncultured Acetatifactor sp.]|uniref:Rpn family recombination-promoting nuclease/putative transposase n=1 Tax=uncultured Acetatifactor sp. TaxID=1671927 RepID=UPI002609552B|nr:Rpn family recombination-promoting nuclease/putative transposase [uncultured Acetatifactor sp.]